MTPDKKPPGDTQLRIIWFAATTFAVAIVFAIVAAIIWGFGETVALLSPVLWPLAISVVLAYLLDPAVGWLERRRISRAWAIAIVFAVVFSVLAGALASVIPQMIKETNKLVSKVPSYTARAQLKLTQWANRAEKAATRPSSQGTNAPAETNSAPAAISAETQTNALAGSNTNADSSALSANIHSIHRQILASASDWTGKLLSRIGSWLLSQLAKATALVDVAIALILIPIYTFYFLLEKRWIRTHWTNYLPVRHSRAKDEIIFILESINQYMIAFFRGQVLVSICSGVLYTIGFLVIGLDYAFLLGFFCLLFTMIPFLGAIVNCIVAVSLTAMQFGDWLHPVLTFALFAVVVSAENFFYSPRIMGNRVGLHPVMIIVAVMIGITLLGGVLGGALAIPLAAALRVMMFRYVWNKKT